VQWADFLSRYFRLRSGIPAIVANPSNFVTLSSVRGMIEGPVHPPSPDNEERRLLAEYETAARFYSWAVCEQVRQHQTASDDDYQKLRRTVENAREECERTRIALKTFRPAN
jgi:hypothetical protein